MNDCLVSINHAMSRQSERYHLMKNNPEWIERKRAHVRKYREKNRDKCNALTRDWIKRKKSEKLKAKEESRIGLELWRSRNCALAFQCCVAVMEFERQRKRQQKRQTHAEIIAAMTPEKLAKYRASNRERARTQHAMNQANPEWRKKKSEYHKARSKTEHAKQLARKVGIESHHRRYGKDAQFTIRHLLRSRIRGALGRGVCKSGNTQELIGCTYDQLRKHIESQFTRGMSWDNQGKWHIDHIIPCAAYDLTKPDRQRTCFNWQNLRPLWGTENARKADKITDGQECLPLSYV